MNLSQQPPVQLVFQPIVKNSILHGILEKPVKEGNIVIMGWMESETEVEIRIPASSESADPTPHMIHYE